MQISGTIRQAILLAWKEVDGFVKRRLFWTLLLVLGTALFAALGPIALKYAIDSLNTGIPHQINLPVPDGWAILQDPTIMVGALGLIGIYAASLWVSRSLGELRWYFFGTADQRLHRRLSRRLFDHVINLPLAFHLDRKTGALNQILVQGLTGYGVLLNHAVFTVLPVLLEVLIIGAVIVAFLEPVFLVILGLSFLAYCVAFAIGAARILGPSRAVSTTQVAAYSNLTDSFLNAETVKCFTAEGHINDQYDAALEKSERQWAIFYGRKTANGILVAAVFALSLGSAVILGVSQVRAGTMTVGEFVLVNTYMLQIVRPLETLGAAFRDMAYAIAFIEKMLALMGRRREGGKPALVRMPQPHQTGQGTLEFKDVGFSYLPERTILEKVSFRLEAGRTLAIVGDSGAGKSSIVRLLLRLYEPGSGEIYLNEKATRELSLSDLRQSVAVVMQDTILFNDTIAYNIAFGRAGCSQAEIEEAARLAHIHDRILQMPNGYQTIVGERGLKLSGGEKQRVAIARAALKKPQMFVFDEATSSLDSKTEQTILDNLLAVSKGMTTLIIAHRLSTITHADLILVMKDGSVIEQGNHDALIQRKGAYASMWRTQQRQQRKASTGQKISA